MGATRAETPTESARRLAAQAGEAAAESERQRRLSPRLVAEMARAGLFRLCVPRAIGGAEAHPAELVEAVEALSAGDGAAGWCLAVIATSGLLGGYLPADAGRALFGGAETVVGGVFAPRGRGLAGGAGFRVSGCWPFASGCHHCHWLMGGATVEDRGELRRLPSGMPDVRLMLAPAADVIVHDTWHVAGLRGTGSHDIEFCDLEIPREHSASVFSDRPTATGPLYAFPLFGLLALAIAGVSLGVARGAMDSLVALAQKRPTAGQRLLGERATVQAEMAQTEAALRAARLLVLDEVQRAWEHATQDGGVPVAQRAALRLAATHAAVTGAEVAQRAYRLAGGSAIYESSPLQRAFRDANVATQHMLVAPATWELTGRMLLGLPADVTQL